MKSLKLLILLILSLSYSCGSSERIITDDGTVYEVKGDTVENNGVDVTENLSASEKASINDLVKRKEKAQSAAQKEQDALEKAIDEQKQIQQKAELKQKELKAKLDALQNQLKESQDARDDYAKIKKRYNEEEKEYKRLESNGELSAIEIKEWKDKLAKLKLEVDQAQSRLKKFD